MSNFTTQLKKANNTTYTTNGDLAVKSTLDANLDFFGAASSLRGNPQKVKELFIEACRENLLLAIKNAFFLRDIRNGNGERDLFRTCLSTLANLYPEAFIKIIPHCVNVGRWDDVLFLAPHKVVGPEILSIVKCQLAKDLKSEDGVSLLAKWMPTESSKDNKTKMLAKFFSKKLFDDNRKAYRKCMTILRKKIDILETRLVNKDYTFEYNHLPSKAMLKYVKAFNRNDKERYEAYLESLKKSVNLDSLAEKAKKVFAYELVHKSRNGTEQEKELANAMWQSIPKDPTDKKILVIRDGSGSMCSRLPKSSVSMLDVATSLTLYASERLTGEFKDLFITFSSTPEIVQLDNTLPLSERVNYLYRNYDDCTNTDILKTYRLILEACKKSKPEDRPSTLLIVSDMQFDSVFSSRPFWLIDRKETTENRQSTFETVKKEFEEAEIEMPKLVFWNVNSSGPLTFATDDLENSLFISGFSSRLFNIIAKGEYPNAKDLMFEALNRYNYLDKVFNL